MILPWTWPKARRFRCLALSRYCFFGAAGGTPEGGAVCLGATPAGAAGRGAGAVVEVVPPPGLALSYNATTSFVMLTASAAQKTGWVWGLTSMITAKPLSFANLSTMA